MLQNSTAVTSFILVGFTNRKEVLIVLFIIFCLIYIFTLLGNVCIIAVTCWNPGLHKPMYFFLANLALFDIIYSTVIAPKMLSLFLMKDKSISYTACVSQMFLFAVLITSESVLLAIMAYDRYLAICNPLRYSSIMSTRFCMQLISGAYINGFVQSLFHTSFTFQLSFCRTEINYFFCDIPPLLKLSCSDTSVNEMILFTFCGFNEGGSALVVLICYFFIVFSLFKIRLAHGGSKAASTCVSHFVVFTLYYGSLFFIYLRPTTIHSMEVDRVASVVYTVAIPMLNPIIYSLRNSEFKSSFKKLLSCSFL
ncbi:olfactory receptor 5B12-like [Hyperolius riggenbachi]|uniref:olfactory receptor 5B12-like n=1 Tax=Hyperolius riggenbachi TaxID=752182 RepID=UPI0035A2F7D9